MFIVLCDSRRLNANNPGSTSCACVHTKVTYLKYFPTSTTHSSHPSLSAYSNVLVIVQFSFFWVLPGLIPCLALSFSVCLFRRSLPHLIAQSKQLLALFEILWTKINLNKCRDLSRYRNVMRVREEQMKKGNKRYTKRMSLPLNITTVFLCLFCTHSYI